MTFPGPLSQLSHAVSDLVHFAVLAVVVILIGSNDIDEKDDAS